MKESLPSQLLNEKLPRFLQKCVQTFESDRRYRNDLRYIRVWLQLMDFVDDPRELLRTMEVNHIGTNRSLFYQAYALHYEKIKKFDEAEKMYHLGVKNLAEPVDELQQSYEQFLHRIERYKKKTTLRQTGKTTKRPLSASSIPPNGSKAEEGKENICRAGDQTPEKILEKSSTGVKPLMESNYASVSENSCNIRTSQDLFKRKEFIGKLAPGSTSKPQETTERESDELQMLCSDDTVAVKFVDSVIVGKSEAEDACHHGLVDPTVNMKEAINAINSMFREPIETVPVGRRSNTIRPREKGASILQHSRTKTCQYQQEQFEIFIDDEQSGEIEERSDEDNFVQNDDQGKIEGSISSGSHGNAFVFLRPKDLASEGSDDQDVESPARAKFGEDTVVCRFVGSTILDEPGEVENVCHHGLVDPTINLKEAMDDINNMFGKPMDFVRTKRSTKQDKAPVQKRDFSGFSILPDDDQEHQEVQMQPNLSAKSREFDLFEPTVFTKEAMDDINKMFGGPLDF